MFFSNFFIYFSQWATNACHAVYERLTLSICRFWQRTIPIRGENLPPGHDLLILKIPSHFFLSFSIFFEKKTILQFFCSVWIFDSSHAYFSRKSIFTRIFCRKQKKMRFSPVRAGALLKSSRLNNTCVLEMCDPPRRNALSVDMMREFDAALDQDFSDTRSILIKSWGVTFNVDIFSIMNFF